MSNPVKSSKANLFMIGFLPSFRLDVWEGEMLQGETRKLKGRARKTLGSEQLKRNLKRSFYILTVLFSRRQLKGTDYFSWQVPKCRKRSFHAMGRELG